MAKAKSKSEKFGEELQDVLLEKIKATDLKTLAEYGIYTSLGLVTFVGLGRIRKEPRPRPGTAEAIANDTRQMLVDMVIAMREFALKELIGIKPFAIFDPLPKWIVRIIGIAESVPGEPGAIYWTPVPLPYRALLSLALPSLLYITIETLKGTIEFG